MGMKQAVAEIKGEWRCRADSNGRIALPRGKHTFNDERGIVLRRFRPLDELRKPRCGIRGVAYEERRFDRTGAGVMMNERRRGGVNSSCGPECATHEEEHSPFERAELDELHARARMDEVAAG